MGSKAAGRALQADKYKELQAVYHMCAKVEEISLERAYLIGPDAEEKREKQTRQGGDSSPSSG